MSEEILFTNESEYDIDPAFNAGFFERLIAFIRELFSKIFGVFSKAL